MSWGSTDLVTLGRIEKRLEEIASALDYSSATEKRKEEARVRHEHNVSSAVNALLVNRPHGDIISIPNVTNIAFMVADEIETIYNARYEAEQKRLREAREARLAQEKLDAIKNFEGVKDEPSGV